MISRYFIQLHTSNVDPITIKGASQGSIKHSDSQNYERPVVAPLYLEGVGQNQTDISP